MAAMRRWLLRCTAGFSFVLFATLLFFSIRSPFTQNKLAILREWSSGNAHERTVWAIELANSLRLSRETLVETGLTQEQVDTLWAEIASKPHWEWTTWPAADDPYRNDPGWHPWDGFAWTREVWPAGDWKLSLVVPYRVLMFMTALLPAFVVLRSIRCRLPRRTGTARRPGSCFAAAAIVSTGLCLLISAVWTQSEVCGAQIRRVEDISGSNVPLYSVAGWVSMPGWCHLSWAHTSELTSDADGRAVTSRASWSAPDTDYFDPQSWALSGVPPRKWAGFRGAGAGWVFQGPIWALEVGVPYWFLWIITAALPFLWLAVRGGWILRRPPGACARCGYDLRASTGRCPECGEAIRTDESPGATGLPPVHVAP